MFPSYSCLFKIFQYDCLLILGLRLMHNLNIFRQYID